MIDPTDRVILNPPPERVIAAGERVVAIASDDTALAVAKPLAGEVDSGAIVSTPPPPRPESILVLGWNDGATAVIREFDKFLLQGSRLVLVTEAPEAQGCVESDCATVSNSQIEIREANPTALETLEAIGIEDFDHVIVLATDGLDAQRADARTLVTLLHLRDIADRRDASFSIVSEMLDERNRQLAEVTRVDDVIVSDKIISLMLTQISETRELSQVFSELFAAEGSEIYLRPAMRLRRARP